MARQHTSKDSDCYFLLVQALGVAVVVGSEELRLGEAEGVQSEWMVDGKLEPVEQDCVRKPLDSRSAISDHHTRYELRISRSAR